MKLLITSDIHGNYENLIKVVNKHKDIDYHLNAGDMGLGKTIIEKYHLVSVKGNTDFGSDMPYQRVLDFKGLKVLLTHGHKQFVKFGLDRLKLKAKLVNAKICIFGHTHQRFLEIDNGILFINPGALGEHNSYAIYENKQVTFYKVESRGSYASK